MNAVLWLLPVLSAQTAPAFPLGVYWPVERVGWVARNAGYEDEWRFQEDLLQRLRAEFHVNTVWAVNGGTRHWQKLLELGERADVAMLVTPEQFIWARDDRRPGAAEAAAKAAFEALGGYPALAGYVLIDEPRAWEMSQMEAFRIGLAALDPARPSVMVTMTGDSDAAALGTRAAVLCTDVYPFFAPRSPNGPNRPDWSRGYYRGMVRRLVRLARESGKTPWIMPQAYAEVWGPWHYDQAMNVVLEPGAYHHWRMPTVGETRWQIWTALVEGAKGIHFFVLFGASNDRRPGDPPPERNFPDTWPRATELTPTGLPEALLRPNGTPTPQLEAIGAAFAFIERHADLLARLTPTPAQLVWAEPPLTARSLVDPTDGRHYAVVCNDDTDQRAEARLGSALPLANALDLRTGARLAGVPDPQTGGSVLTLTLEPGDGTVVALEAAPGAAARALYSADFRVSVPIRTDGLRVVAARAPYGMGWDHFLAPAEEGKAGSGEIDLDRVAGKTGREAMTILARLFGQGAAGEPLRLEASAGDGAYEASTDSAGERPWRVPPGPTRLRVTVPAGGRLDGLELVGVVAP